MQKQGSGLTAAVGKALPASERKGLSIDWMSLSVFSEQLTGPNQPLLSAANSLPLACRFLFSALPCPPVQSTRAFDPRIACSSRGHA